ncbi:MAG: cation:proton antiporter [bacterium]|nr:cation:proton antiporter [bacterium]
MEGDIFVEISALLALSAVVALIMRALKQPMIIGYILTGLLVGPSALGVVESAGTIEALGSFGVALLLFIVGLGLNIKVVKEVGRVSLITGVGQVAFTSIIGFMIVRALGLGTTESIYVAIALTFSSTIIILKLLTDKKEQNKLYGKIAIGFLLVQDIIATFAILVASASGSGNIKLSDFASLAGRALLVVLVVLLVVKYILKPMTNFLSNSQELLFLFAIAWGLGIATIFYELDFSLEVGALFAGVALASMPYAREIGSRLRPLRDFFIIVFFISLGAQLNVADFGSVIGQALLLSAFVVIGNPIIVMIIMGLMGYTKKTSFNAGLAVAQISEFSLIFILLGFRNGHVSEQTVSMITIVGIITIAISSYMIIYSNGLYNTIEKYLRLFERRKIKDEHEARHRYDGVILGYKKGGKEFVKVFENSNKKYVVVDYDPEAIDSMERGDIPYIYGDVTDTELLNELNLEHVKIVVSVMTSYETNLFILQHLDKVNPNAVSICHAESIKHAVELYALGASFVVLPHLIGNEKVSNFIRRNGFSKTQFKKYKTQHVRHLKRESTKSED